MSQCILENLLSNGSCNTNSSVNVYLSFTFIEFFKCSWIEPEGSSWYCGSSRMRQNVWISRCANRSFPFRDWVVSGSSKLYLLRSWYLHTFDVYSLFRQHKPIFFPGEGAMATSSSAFERPLKSANAVPYYTKPRSIELHYRTAVASTCYGASAPQLTLFISSCSLHKPSIYAEKSCFRCIFSRFIFRFLWPREEERSFTSDCFLPSFLPSLCLMNDLRAVQPGMSRPRNGSVTSLRLDNSPLVKTEPGDTSVVQAVKYGDTRWWPLGFEVNRVTFGIWCEPVMSVRWNGPGSDDCYCLAFFLVQQLDIR